MLNIQAIVPSVTSYTKEALLDPKNSLAIVMPLGAYAITTLKARRSTHRRKSLQQDAIGICRLLKTIPGATGGPAIQQLLADSRRELEGVVEKLNALSDPPPPHGLSRSLLLFAPASPLAWIAHISFFLRIILTEERLRHGVGSDDTPLIACIYSAVFVLLFRACALRLHELRNIRVATPPLRSSKWWLLYTVHDYATWRYQVGFFVLMGHIVLFSTAEANNLLLQLDRDSWTLVLYVSNLLLTLVVPTLLVRRVAELLATVEPVAQLPSPSPLRRWMLLYPMSTPDALPFQAGYLFILCTILRTAVTVFLLRGLEVRLAPGVGLLGLAAFVHAELLPARTARLLEEVRAAGVPDLNPKGLAKWLLAYRCARHGVRVRVAYWLWIGLGGFLVAKGASMRSARVVEASLLIVGAILSLQRRAELLGALRIAERRQERIDVTRHGDHEARLENEATKEVEPGAGDATVLG
jgi:hypothetical protein